MIKVFLVYGFMKKKDYLGSLFVSVHGVVQAYCGTRSVIPDKILNS